MKGEEFVMILMEPVITVVVRDDFTPVGDLTESEVMWLINHMDWTMEKIQEGFVAFHFYIPVSRKVSFTSSRGAFVPRLREFMPKNEE
jgi:hypothetical protein